MCKLRRRSEAYHLSIAYLTNPFAQSSTTRRQVAGHGMYPALLDPELSL